MVSHSQSLPPSCLMRDSHVASVDTILLSVCVVPAKDALHLLHLLEAPVPFHIQWALVPASVSLLHVLPQVPVLESVLLRFPFWCRMFVFVAVCSCLFSRGSRVRFVCWTLSTANVSGDRFSCIGSAAISGWYSSSPSGLDMLHIWDMKPTQCSPVMSSVYSGVHL